MVESIENHLKAFEWKSRVLPRKESEVKEMTVQKFAVQYRFKGVWLDFAKYNSESDAREKAKKLLKFGAARVVPVWA